MAGVRWHEGCISRVRMCEERLKLLRELSRATLDLVEAVRELSHLSNSASVEEYTLMVNKAGKMRLAAEAARLALKRHVEEHRC